MTYLSYRENTSDGSVLQVTTLSDPELKFGKFYSPTELFISLYTGTLFLKNFPDLVPIDGIRGPF